MEQLVHMLLAGSVSTPVSAASDAYCSGYAATAVQQHRKNVRLGCGFGGTRWKNDVAGHFLYCKIAKKSVTRAETRTRTRKLNRCGRHLGGGSRCKARLKISHIGSSKTEAQLGAAFSWVRAAKDNYGGKYSNWSNARAKSKGCRQRGNGSYKCFVKAKPCKA